MNLPLTVLPATRRPTQLPAAEATTYAAWFACLAEPMRVRLLHAVASAGHAVTIGDLTELLGISQPTCSHHVRKLAEVGFVRTRRDGKTTLVTVNPACCTGLPHAADAVMGMVDLGPCCADDLPTDVSVRPLEPDDWPAVRRIHADGIATGHATVDTEVPDRRTLDRDWLPDHRWVAEIDNVLVGWTAATPVSTHPAYSGVADTQTYVAEGHRGRGVGKTLLHHQVTAADAAGLWTLQAQVFPENRAAIALHHAAGYRTLGIRDRIAHHQNTWRDTILLERRRTDPC